jgi:hypothetical protein
MVQTILFSIFGDAEVEFRITDLGPFTNGAAMKCPGLAAFMLRLVFNPPGIELALVFPPVPEPRDGPNEVGKKRQAISQEEEWIGEARENNGRQENGRKNPNLYRENEEEEEFDVRE